MNASWFILGSALAVGVGSWTYALEPEGSHPIADCSLDSLRGDYLGNISGTALNRGAFALQAHLRLDGDGAGHVAGAVLVSETAGSTVFTARITYTLNADCMGTLEVRTTAQVSRYNIAVLEAGREIAVVTADPGFVGTGVLKRSP
jgi:hypothetical protein